MTIKLGIAGARGRMGLALLDVIADTDGVELSAASLHPSETGAGDSVDLRPGVPSSARYTHSAEELFALSDCVIDFTAPAATVSHATIAAQTGKALVVGTTGMDATQNDAIAVAGRATRVFQAANFSLGVNLLAALTQIAAARLGDDWDIEVLEMHHRAKVDAPSGTALRLGEAAAKGRAVSLDDKSVRIRDGIMDPRTAGDIGFATLRGGTVAGDHTVLLAGENERLELRHTAESRIIFARGAIKAAQWISNQSDNGYYTPNDMLGLSDLIKG